MGSSAMGHMRTQLCRLEGQSHKPLYLTDAARQQTHYRTSRFSLHHVAPQFEILMPKLSTMQGGCG